MYQAKRISLNEAELYDTSGVLLGRSVLPNGIWKTEGAPISDALSDKLQSRPELEVGGKKYRVHKRLASNKFFLNDYVLTLKAEDGADVMSVDSKGGKWTSDISYAGQNYKLIRHGLFRFDFSLEQDGRKIAQFSDVSPFLTFSSKREYKIETGNPVDHALLSFCLFLVICWFY